MVVGRPFGAALRRARDALVGPLERRLGRVEQLVRVSAVATGEHEVLVRLRSGQLVYVDPRDVSVAPHLIARGEWEPRITEAWAASIRHGDLVIDAGANFGWYGLAAAATGRAARIHLIEANPTLIGPLRKTLSANGLRGLATVTHAALAERDGPVVLNVLEDNWGSSSLTPAQELVGTMPYAERVAERAEVDGIGLDAFCVANNAFAARCSIKMDIEGLEGRVLRAAPRLLAHARAGRVNLFTELTPAREENPHAVVAMLAEHFDVVEDITDGAPGTPISTYAQVEAAMRARRSEWIMLHCRAAHDTAARTN